MDYIDAASAMAGRSRLEGSGARHVTNAHAVTGTAMADSSDGTVLVDLGGDVTTGDGSQWVEVQTDAHVLEGDQVDVLLVGEAGRGMSPVIYGVPGGGDRMAASVSNAETLATEAQEVAQATGQHFWPDTDGVHVTEVTQDEWNDSTGTSYHSGANVLLNALGQLFRDGLNNLLSLTTGSTHTETFEIRSDEDYYYELTYRPMVVESVTIDGTATSDYTWTNSGHVVGSGKLGTLVLGYDTWYANPGATLSVTYRTSPAMTVWDGLGNLAANVMSYFTADEIGLGGNIFSDPHGTSRGAAVRFFGATDEQGASLTSGIQRDSGTGYTSYTDTIGLTGTTTDEGAALSNGCISDYGINAMGYLYDDSEPSNDYRVESTANLYARSRSSDAYDAADATARLGVKTVTIGDSGEYSYVTLGDGTGEDTEVPMRQAIVALQQPYAMFTGSSGTATSNASGWRITWFNTVYSHSANWSDYFSFSNGVITAKRNIQLEISGCMNWTDSIAGNRGFGVWVNSSTVGSGSEYSAFQYFPNTVNTRKSVWLTGLVLSLDANMHCAVGRYENNGAVYVNGTNFSRILLKVLGTF